MTAEVLSGTPAMSRLYARALLPRLSRGTTLPDRTLRLDAVPVDVDHLAAYDRLCGFALRDTLPPTYPHVLGFPLQLALLTDPAFPLAAAGLVHVRNVITQRRALRLGEQLTVAVRAEALATGDRGTAVDLVTEVSVADEPAWTGRSTYLARRRGGGRPREERARVAADGRASGTLRVPADVGRRYAAVSGDVNPIHLHPLTARLFGFRRPPAHGMWSAARLLAALEGRLPDALTADVSFRKPLLVPATVTRVTRAREDGWEVALVSPSGSPHVIGTVVDCTDDHI